MGTQGRTPAFGFILATVALDALSNGLIFPVLPRLVLGLTHDQSGAAATAVGLIGAAWAAANFIASPVLGALSDRFGRRPVLLISTFGSAIDLAVMAMAPTLSWLVIGRLVCGATAANMATSAAYLADVTSPEQRARRFGLFSAIYGGGMILGPALGGLLGEVSPRAPFWVASGLTAMAWLYGLLVLPESLPRDRRSPWSWKAALPVRSFGVYGRDATLIGLGASSFIVQLAAQTANVLFVLYTAQRYGWTSATVGGFLMVFSAGNVAIQGWLGPRLSARFGEWPTLAGGLALLGAGLVGGALSTGSASFCLASAVLCLGNIFGPSLQALMSRRKPADAQGKLQGVLSAQAAIAGMTGPVIFTQLYAWSLVSPSAPAGPGLALLIAGGLTWAALAVALSAAALDRGGRHASA